MKYNVEADEYLNNLYKSVGAKTDKQKYHTLELKLGIVPGTQSFSHPLSWGQKVGILEYEVLECKELITLVLA